jgi:hypothetical protein
VLLDRLGRKPEAQRVLASQVDALPPAETERRDRTLLMLGLIAGANTQTGREAFQKLLLNGNDREWQRIALLRLSAAATNDRASAAELQRRLDEILAKSGHPLTEDVLFFRAELRLRAKEFERAEEDANALLTRFPGSDLRRNALA